MIFSQLRARYAILFFLVIGLGLASRQKSIQSWLPVFISEYAGDALYALMIFFGLSLIWPKKPIRQIAVMAFIFCLIIELSQLYHAPWIEGIRRTRLGGLILGFGFLWSDVICYFVGVSIGWLINWFLQPRNPGRIFLRS